MIFKKIPYILFFLSLIGFPQSNNRTQDIYLDSDGNQITYKEFRTQWTNRSRWDYLNNKGRRVNSLNDTLFLTFKADYNSLRNKLEDITNTFIPANSTILIEYYYLNDLCSNSTPDNNWNKSRVWERKRFLKSYKKKLEENSNLYIVFLFEEGIKLFSKTSAKSEYFYTDEENFFRNNIFMIPTLCGSFGAIKPNGEILVRNGENRIDHFAEYLKEENWKLFFPKN